MERETFRMLIWRQLARLIPLPIVALMLYLTPFTRGWSLSMWIALGVAAGAAVVFYLVRSWQQALIVLDDDGLKVYSSGALTVWPHQDLLRIKEVGRFRARMCYHHPDAKDHAHVWFDVVGRDGFTDALLDWYEHTTGHELPEFDTHEQAA